MGRAGPAVRRYVIVVCGLVLATGLAGGARSDGVLARPTVVGSLSRFPADVAAAVGVADLKAATEDNYDNGVALNYPKLDRLYQLYNLKPTAAGGGMVVAERDRGSLRLLRTLRIPGHHALMANGASGAEWVSTFDTKRNRLYVGFGSTGGVVGYAAATNGNNLPGLLGIDLQTFTYTVSRFPRFLVNAGDLAGIPVGLEFDESTDTLLLLEAGFHGTSSLGNVLGLIGWTSAQLAAGGELPAVAPRPVRSCRRDPINDATSRYLTPMLITRAPDVDGDGSLKTFVIFPCYSTTFSSNVIVARLDRATALDPASRQERALVAPAGVAHWDLDAAHGRLFLTNASAETDTWVYEAFSNAFVGIIETSPRGTNVATALSTGVDETTGRLYARAEGNGLMIAEAAQDPVPQANVYPEFSAVGGYRILPDEVRSRIFLLAGTSTGIGQTAPAYQIVEVPRALPAPPKDDPDSRTLQIDEVAGQTVAQYGGNASAYGLRVLLARGVGGAVPSNGNDTAGDFYENLNSYCGFTDRELVLAAVPRTELSDISKFATAAAVNLDSVTVTDLSVPSRCDVYNSYSGPFFPVTALTPFLRFTGALQRADGAGSGAPSGTFNTVIGPRTRWDYTAADCSTRDGEDQAGPNSAPLAGPTSVDCVKPGAVSAKAEGYARQVPGASVTIGRAVASTQVKLDPAKGLVSEATARVENVRIGDYTIGFIANTARSYARGRTGTARTEWTKPRIGFVEGPGIPACTDQCDIDAVISSLNTALTGRAEFRRIVPETRLAAGSPGGYEAGILKSEKQKASDNSLSGDKSVEIPAVELVIYNDNSVIGRARQVFQFAGTRVDSHYGIQSVRGGSCESCTDAGPVPAGPAVLGQGDTATLGAAPPAAAAANPVVRFFREVAEGLKYALRLLANNPREAAVLATVWAFLAAPFVAARRRRALLDVVGGQLS